MALITGKGKSSRSLLLLLGNKSHAIGKASGAFISHSYRSLQNKPGNDGIPGVYSKKNRTALFDLRKTLVKKDISKEHPEIVNSLKKLVKTH